MDRADLETQLAEGRSLAEIGRRTGKHPSTVSYWVRKHGLELTESARHAPRGCVPKDVMASLVERGLSTREIAEAVGRSQHTVRYWLGKYGLSTGRPSRPHRPARATYSVRPCRTHGPTRHVQQETGSFRCARCRSEAVARWRRRVKATLVAEAGGACRCCGYRDCPAALHFHHVDPATKLFGIGGRGLAHSMELLRVEAAKCVLLCSNCHAEVEAGFRHLS